MTQEKFVERFESAVVEFAILNRASMMNEVTPDQVSSDLPKGNAIGRERITRAFEKLVSDGHLQKNGDKYKISDDGREDVQKLQPLALELPQLVHKGSGNPQQGQQRATMSQAPTTSGASGGNVGNRPSATTPGQGNAGNKPDANKSPGYGGSNQPR